MKKALQILGAVFALLVVAVLGFVGFAAYTGGRFDASSKSYVDAAVPLIVANWSESELTARAAPQLMQTTTPEQLTKLFTWFSSLGPMKKYCGSQGQSSVFMSPQEGKTVSARYVACAKFERAEASIQITLIQDKDKAWKIAGFHVNSQALVPQ